MYIITVEYSGRVIDVWKLRTKPTLTETKTFLRTDAQRHREIAQKLRFLPGKKPDMTIDNLELSHRENDWASFLQEAANNINDCVIRSRKCTQ
jgi:hypothetical protein